jgi:hypothetical protein
VAPHGDGAGGVHGPPGVLKGDQKFGQYLEGFLKSLKEKGDLAALYKQFMTAEQIRATQ